MKHQRGRKEEGGRRKEEEGRRSNKTCANSCMGGQEEAGRWRGATLTCLLPPPPHAALHAPQRCLSSYITSTPCTARSTLTLSTYQRLPPRSPHGVRACAAICACLPLLPLALTSRFAAEEGGEGGREGISCRRVATRQTSKDKRGIWRCVGM